MSSLGMNPQKWEIHNFKCFTFLCGRIRFKINIPNALPHKAYTRHPLEINSMKPYVETF